MAHYLQNQMPRIAEVQPGEGFTIALEAAIELGAPPAAESFSMTQRCVDGNGTVTQVFEAEDGERYQPLCEISREGVAQASGRLLSGEELTEVVRGRTMSDLQRNRLYSGCRIWPGNYLALGSVIGRYPRPTNSAQVSRVLGPVACIVAFGSEAAPAHYRATPITLKTTAFIRQEFGDVAPLKLRPHSN